jgi:hypothetical protein
MHLCPDCQAKADAKVLGKMNAIFEKPIEQVGRAYKNGNLPDTPYFKIPYDHFLAENMEAQNRWNKAVKDRLEGME